MFFKASVKPQGPLSPSIRNSDYISADKPLQFMERKMLQFGLFMEQHLWLENEANVRDKEIQFWSVHLRPAVETPEVTKANLYSRNKHVHMNGFSLEKLTLSATHCTGSRPVLNLTLGFYFVLVVVSL